MFTEMSSGLRAAEMYERQSWFRDRAQRESGHVGVDRPPRHLLRKVTRRG